jgi:hypothetical protein
MSERVGRLVLAAVTRTVAILATFLPLVFLNLQFVAREL